MARKYGIEDKLPILIAEKTGPHFAFGDTCYSWQGENPNGSSFTLSFSDNYGEFQVFPAEKGTATKLYGDCIVTNSSFAIIDRESGEVVVFDYTLLGDTMELSYEGGVITLEKLMTTESSS